MLHLQWLKMLAIFPVLWIFAIFLHSSLCEHGSGCSFSKRGLCSPHKWNGQISEADNPTQTVAKLPPRAVHWEPACLPRTQDGPTSLWLNNEWLQGCYHPLPCTRGPGHPMWPHLHFDKHIWKVPSNPQSWRARRVCWSPCLVPQALAAGWVASGTMCYWEWILCHHHHGVILGTHMLSLTEPRFWQLSENHQCPQTHTRVRWDCGTSSCRYLKIPGCLIWSAVDLTVETVLFPWWLVSWQKLPVSYKWPAKPAGQSRASVVKVEGTAPGILNEKEIRADKNKAQGLPWKMGSVMSIRPPSGRGTPTLDRLVRAWPMAPPQWKEARSSFRPDHPDWCVKCLGPQEEDSRGQGLWNRRGKCMGVHTQAHTLDWGTIRIKKALNAEAVWELGAHT